MATQFKDLAAENVVSILEYLRAVDLVSVSETSKTIFHRSRISMAIEFQLEKIYLSTSSPVKDKRKQCNSSDYGCNILYIREVKSILMALGSPVPVNGRGYWISTSWVANAKKHFESLNLPEISSSGKRSTPKKLSKRQADALPPTLSMNADITCHHGSLALTKGLRAKKRLVDKDSWYFLRKLYPSGPQYKSTLAMECDTCLSEDGKGKACATEKRELGLRVRRSGFVSGPLESVAARKSGIPPLKLSQKMIPGKKLLLFI
jgi:hypothetical protein